MIILFSGIFGIIFLAVDIDTKLDLTISIVSSFLLAYSMYPVVKLGRISKALLVLWRRKGLGK